MQQNKNKSGVVAGIMLPMGLVCLFAFCSLALAIFGGKAYRNIQASVDDSYGSTVAASYLRTRIAQAKGSQVLLREEEGIQVLSIGFTANGEAYETRIFMQDGRLVESFERADAPFDKNSGVEIAPLKNCRFEITDDGLFIANLESLGGSQVRTAVAVMEGGRL